MSRASKFVVCWLIACFLTMVVCLFLGLSAVCQAGGPPKPRGFYKAEVLEIHDGDTPRVILQSPLGDTVRWLRLDGADTPEIGQPWGREALARTAELIQGQKLIIEITPAAPSYGRPIAIIWLSDGRDLAQVLVEEGLAWVDPRYARGARGKELKALQAQAKAARRGLWADSAPIAPWKWRKGERGQ